MSSDVNVRFIKNCNDPYVLELLESIYQQLNEEKIGKLFWLTEEECLGLKTFEERAFFVFGSFSGEAFNKLMSLGGRIYGAPCILQCMKAGKTLPRQVHPVYSLAMKGIVATCTNISTALRKEIHQKIEWMMGETSKVMNENVSYLVAGEVGSKKYLVAGARKIKIMLPEWVDALWQESLRGEVHGSDGIYDKFKCPIFRGFSVCASGLPVQERMKIKNMVEAEGGQFNGMMKVNECTHLVISEPKGQKYQFAKEWNINTVIPEWIYDSVEAGYCLEESKYLLEGDLKKSSFKVTSTPDHTSRKECDISSISNLSSITVTHVNETDFSVRNDTMASKLHSTQADGNPNFGLFDVIDVRCPRNDGYLNGCKVYLHGPTLENSDKARILINKGSGMRFNQLNEAVSHVVAEIVNEKLTQQLMRLPNRPHVVSPQWLLECFKQGRCLPEDGFSLMQNNHTDQSLSSLVKGSKPQVVRTHAKSVCNPSNNDGNADIASLCYQYASASQKKGDDHGGSQVIAAAKVTEEMNKNVSSLAEEYEEMDHDGIENKTIFAGLTFMIFNQEFVDELTTEIQMYGGRVLPLNSRKVANIGVVPIEGCPVTRTVDEVVTSAWVNFCIEELRLVSYDYLEIFRPLTILPNFQPLKECVLSISGVHRLEKNIIVDLIQLLGGRVQDCFVRVRKENFLACTHLVANSQEGPKYEAAVKWGIPIVSKSWVYECASSGKKASEKKHSLQQIEINKSVNRVSQVVVNENFKGINKKLDSPHKINTSSKKLPNEEMIKPSENFNLMGAKIPVSSGNTEYAEPQNEKLRDNVVEKDGILTRIKEIHSDAKSTPVVKKLANKMPIQPTGSLKNTRVKALIEDNNRHDENTPSKFMSGLPHRPCFDFQDSLSGLQSPVVIAKTNTRLSLPLEEVFAKNIKMALKNGANVYNQDDSFSQEHSSVTMHFNQPEKIMPLKGVVISAGKKLIRNQAEYNKLATELGAEYRGSCSDECTHFIFQGKPNDTNREFRSARDQGKFIVSPHWLRACQLQNKRVDEAIYPHTFNENMTPVVVGTKTPSRPYRNSPKEINISSLIELSPQKDFSTPPQLEQVVNPANKVFINDLKKLTEASRSSLKGKKQVIAKTVNKPETKEFMNGPKDVDEEEQHDEVPEKTSDCLNQVKPDAKVQASQVEVTWDYPTISRNLDNFVETGHKISNNGDSIGNNLNTFSKQNSNVGPNRTKMCKFMLSGFKPQEKEELASMVESLGASLVDGSCSHLISNIPNRSEKFLACVSSGKWVLHKSYLSASIQAGYLIEEEDYEWGSEKILKNHPNLTQQETKLALSARSWRLKLQDGASDKGAFSGWKCLLLMDPKKADGISRLLSTGGAAIISKDHWETGRVTHAFIELKNISTPVDLDKMVSLGIHCLKPEYISSCLTDHSQAEPSNFYIPEATNLKRCSDENFRIPRLNKSRKLL